MKFRKHKENPKIEYNLDIEGARLNYGIYIDADIVGDFVLEIN